MLSQLFESVLDLIVQTSTNLPPDVRAAMSHTAGAESSGSRSSQALDIISLNIDQASDCEGAICQDTGMLTFEIQTPVDVNQIVNVDQLAERFAAVSKIVGKFAVFFLHFGTKCLILQRNSHFYQK